MRLERLIFHQVGLWGEPIELPIDPRLTIIVGDNEAGKSTAMRAIDALFFGVERALAAPLSEAQFHAEGEAISADGRPLRWGRRGRTLLAEPPMDALVGALLAPHHRARFRSIFHLGHSDIGGGPELLGADGALGSIIYAASTGVNVSLVESLYASLSSRLKDISGRAQKHQGINLLLPALAAKERELREAVRFGDYESAQAELDAIIERLEANEASQEESQERLRRLRQRIARAESAAEAQALKERLSAHLSSRTLPDPRWVEQLLIAWDSLKKARSHAESAGRERSASEDERAALGDEPKLALYADELAAMAQRAEDAPKHRAALHKIETRIDENLEKLRRALELSAGLSLEAALERARSTILSEALRESLRGALHIWDAAEDERLRAERALEQQKRARSLLPAIPDVLPIRPLEQAEALLSPLADHLRDAGAQRAELGGLFRRGSALMAKLGIANLSAEEIRSLAPAPIAQLERASATRAQAIEAFERAESERARLQSEIDAAKQTLDEAGSALGEIPTDEALDEAREERDTAWSTALSAIARMQAQPAEGAQIEEPLRRFERAMRRVDRLMELRFEGATRLGELGERRRELERRASLLPKAEDARRLSASALEEAEARWHELWPFLAVPPSDHARWLEDFEALRAGWVEETRLQQLAQAAEARAEDYLGDIQKILRDELQEASTLRTPAALAQAIKAELERRRAYNHEVVELRRNAEQLDTAIRGAEGAFESADQSLLEAERAWHERIAKLPEGVSRERESLRATLARQEELKLLIVALEESTAEAARLERILADFEGDASALLRTTSDLVKSVDLPETLPAHSAIQWAHREARSALERSRAIESAEMKLEQQRVAEAQARSGLRSAQEYFEALWDAHGSEEEPSDTSVERAADWAREALRLASALARAEDELARFALPNFEAEEERSPIALQEEAADIEANIHALGVERGELRERQRRAQAELNRLAESAPLAIAEEREEIRELILSRTHEIATLQTALFLLSRAQERAEGAAEPIVKKASAIFSQLTEGRYEGLLLSQGDGSPLEAVTASGRALAPEALSDGTRDQIWLSLRLATAMRAHEETPFPLILDDILVHFDEARTAAALELFAELSERVQIILFTHHDHVAHLAAKAIPRRYSLRLLARARESEREAEKTLADPRPAFERPEEITGRTLEERRLGQRRGELLGDDEYELILEILAAYPEREFTKGEIVEYAAVRGVEISDDVWRALANRMKDDHRVEITGERRGTRYRSITASGF